MNMNMNININININFFFFYYRLLGCAIKKPLFAASWPSTEVPRAFRQLWVSVNA